TRAGPIHSGRHRRRWGDAVRRTRIDRPANIQSSRMVRDGGRRMPRSGDAIAQRIDTASDAPARKETSRALAALAGAVLAIAGAVIVHRHGYAGHALIAIGAVLFLLAPQWRTAESEVAVPSVVSRTSIAGLLLLTLATGTSIFSLSDRAVVVSWLAGCVA